MLLVELVFVLKIEMFIFNHTLGLAIYRNQNIKGKHLVNNYLGKPNLYSANGEIWWWKKF